MDLSKKMVSLDECTYVGLQFVDKAKYAETDTYLAHVYVTDNHSNVLMVTDK